MMTIHRSVRFGAKTSVARLDWLCWFTAVVGFVAVDAFA